MMTNRDFSIRILIILAVTAPAAWCWRFGDYRGSLLWAQHHLDGGRQQPSLPRTVNVTNREALASTVYVEGPKDAPVTVVEISGDTCPFCRKFYGNIDATVKRYNAAFYVADVQTHPGSKELAMEELKWANRPGFGSLHRWLMTTGDSQNPPTPAQVDAKMKGVPPTSDPQKLWSDASALYGKLGNPGTPSCLVLKGGKATLCMLNDLDKVMKS